MSRSRTLSGLPLTLLTVADVALLAAFWWLGLSVLAGFFAMVLGYLSTLWLVELGYWERLPAWMFTLLPGVREALEHQHRKRENETIAATMEKVLQVQGLAEDPAAVLSGCANALPTDLTEDERIECCAARTSKRLASPESGELPSWVLELLYHEWTGQVPGHLWPVKAERRRQLATVLLGRSRRFARWRERLSMQAEDLDRLLGDMDDQGFRLHDLVERLRTTYDLWALENAFLIFLRENELTAPDERLDLADTVQLIERIEGSDDALAGLSAALELDSANRLLLLALLDLGETALRRRDPQLPDDERQRRVLLAIVLFAARTFTALRVQGTACRLLTTPSPGAAEPAETTRNPWRRDGVRLAWCYLSTKQDFRNGSWICSKPYVCLGEFYDQWRSRLEERAAELGGALDFELHALRRSLIQGRWVISKDDLMQRVFSSEVHETDLAAPEPTPSEPPRTAARPAPTASTPPQEVLRHFPEVDAMLRKLAAEVDLATVERYVETRRVAPYLVTLGPSAGPLPRLLDCLSTPGKHDLLESAGIRPKTEDGQDFYNFRPYTPYTRVGLVPRGVPFTTFARTFRSDVARLLVHQEEILPATRKEPVGEYYEVLLHGFNPAASNPLGFGRPKREGGAMQRIKELFAEHLEAKELLSLLAYAGLPGRPGSGHLLDVLLSTPLAGPTRAWDGLTGSARTELAAAEPAIQRDFLASLDDAGIDHADPLVPRSEARRLASELLAVAVRHRVEPLAAAEELSDRIADAYLEGLRRSSPDRPLDGLADCRLDGATRSWEDVSPEDRAELDRVEGAVKRDLLAELGIADEKDERKLMHSLWADDESWQHSAGLVAQAVRNHSPHLANRPALVERVAGAFIGAVQAEAGGLASLEVTLGRSVLIGGRDRVAGP